MNGQRPLGLNVRSHFSDFAQIPERCERGDIAYNREAIYFVAGKVEVQENRLSEDVGSA